VGRIGECLPGVVVVGEVVNRRSRNVTRFCSLVAAHAGEPAQLLDRHRRALIRLRRLRDLVACASPCSSPPPHLEHPSSGELVVVCKRYVEPAVEGSRTGKRPGEMRPSFMS
jgi:hypothetical protein